MHFGASLFACQLAAFALILPLLAPRTEAISDYIKKSPSFRGKVSLDEPKGRKINVHDETDPTKTSSSSPKAYTVRKDRPDVQKMVSKDTKSAPKPSVKLVASENSYLKNYIEKTSDSQRNYDYDFDYIKPMKCSKTLDCKQCIYTFLLLNALEAMQSKEPQFHAKHSGRPKPQNNFISSGSMPEAFFSTDESTALSAPNVQSYLASSPHVVPERYLKNSANYEKSVRSGANQRKRANEKSQTASGLGRMAKVGRRLSHMMRSHGIDLTKISRVLNNQYTVEPFYDTKSTSTSPAGFWVTYPVFVKDITSPSQRYASF